MLKTYRTCNSVVEFLKYEFNNKLLSGVTLFRINTRCNLNSYKHTKKKTPLRLGLDCNKKEKKICVCVFFVDPMHCSRDPQVQISTNFSLKLIPTTLFTHLKIILLQYFQFSVINSIQTDPKYEFI